MVRAEIDASETGHKVQYTFHVVDGKMQSRVDWAIVSGDLSSSLDLTVITDANRRILQHFPHSIFCRRVVECPAQVPRGAVPRVGTRRPSPAAGRIQHHLHGLGAVLVRARLQAGRASRRPLHRQWHLVPRFAVVQR